MEQSRIILTGAKGLLGNKISKFLRSIGFEVLELDLSLGHDLANEEFVSTWFKSNQAEHLINCFAIDDPETLGGNRSTFLNIPLSSFSAMLHVNVVALFSVCREYIRNNKSGNIVNFSSIYSVVSPRPELYGMGEKHIAYGVSKAAVNQLTTHLAVHAAPSFRVNSIVLGGIHNRQSPEFVSNYEKNVPLKRMGSPEDLFGLLEYLCSDKSNYITGCKLVIDGGWTLL